MSSPASTGSKKATGAGFVLAHPLDDFYSSAGLTLPPLQQVHGEEVPEPYKTLLVHQNDMTPTLEKFHGRDIHLRVIGRRRKGNKYYREVVLLTDGENKPVEFGAIKINLDRFSPERREEILEEKRPLGHILNERGVPHASRPKAFLRVASDKLINSVLDLTGAHVLYGRRNTLFDPENHPLAEIVEILPPVASTK